MCVSVTNGSGGLEGETHVTFVLTVYCVMNGSGSSVGGTTLVTFVHINVLTLTQCLTETLPHKAVGESG